MNHYHRDPIRCTGAECRRNRYEEERGREEGDDGDSKEHEIESREIKRRFWQTETRERKSDSAPKGEKSNKTSAPEMRPNDPLNPDPMRPGVTPTFPRPRPRLRQPRRRRLNLKSQPDEFLRRCYDSRNYSRRFSFIVCSRHRP